MNVTAEIYGHAVILNVNGELTEDTLEAFRQAAGHHLAGKEVVDLVLNMDEVPFVDSASLEYLLELRETLAERFGQVRLAKCDDNVRKILEITRLDKQFEVFDEIAEAVKAIQP